MANHIFDCVIAVDSAMGNFSIVGGNTSNITGYDISGISFTAISTNGRCIISGADTTDIIVDFGYMNIGGSGLLTTMQYITFSNPLTMGDIKCPTLTAGSARVYLA